jgi:hypothetical protein
LTCSVPGHCQADQKVIIRTHNETADNNSNLTVVTSTEHDNHHHHNNTHWETDSHSSALPPVDSLARILRLLGFRREQQTFPKRVTNTDNGETDTMTVTFMATIMDRGFQTEELATKTTELIWCALYHSCPDFVQDVFPGATMEECQATVWTLLGFVTRKRPIPNYDLSETYYHTALEVLRNQTVTTTTSTSITTTTYCCTALSYLSQLYLSKGDIINATDTIATLCTDCGGQGQQDELDHMDLIRQVEYEYYNLAAVGADWKQFDEICILWRSTGSGSSSSSGGSFPIRHLATTETLTTMVGLSSSCAVLARTINLFITLSLVSRTVFN